jgi:hypothetical protein
MIDPDLKSLRRTVRPDARTPHDWSHPAVGSDAAPPLPPWRSPRPGFAELMQDKRGLFADALVRERLEALLTRRIAERDAEQNLRRGERDRLIRTRAKSRRHEFADALGLHLGRRFDLNAISRQAAPMRWAKGFMERRTHHPEDLSAGFEAATATWLSDSAGKPAAVALQPKFYDAESAFLSGCAARVASGRGVDILEFPEELGWLSRPAEPRALLLWVPVPLDD